MSSNVFQYNCCENRWWGNISNNKCFTCKKTCEILPLAQMIGIGRFKCKCGRKYQGFSRGDTTSKCHACNTENLPYTILPGDKAARDDRNRENSHYCNACKGNSDCPIVNACKAKRNIQY